MSVGSNLFRDFLMESRLSKLSVADIFPFLSSLYWHIIFFLHLNYLPCFTLLSPLALVI